MDNDGTDVQIVGRRELPISPADDPRHHEWLARRMLELVPGYQKFTLPQLVAVAAYANSIGLNPVKKEVWPIKTRLKIDGQWVWVVQAHIGYRGHEKLLEDRILREGGRSGTFTRESTRITDTETRASLNIPPRAVAYECLLYDEVTTEQWMSNLERLAKAGYPWEQAREMAGERPASRGVGFALPESPDPDCKVCEGTGWVRRRNSQGEGWNNRCSCYEASDMPTAQRADKRAFCAAARMRGGLPSSTVSVGRLADMITEPDEDEPTVVSPDERPAPREQALPVEYPRGQAVLFKTGGGDDTEQMQGQPREQALLVEPPRPQGMLFKAGGGRCGTRDERMQWQPHGVDIAPVPFTRTGWANWMIDNSVSADDIRAALGDDSPTYWSVTHDRNPDLMARTVLEHATGLAKREYEALVDRTRAIGAEAEGLSDQWNLGEIKRRSNELHLKLHEHDEYCDAMGASQNGGDRECLACTMAELGKSPTGDHALWCDFAAAGATNEQHGGPDETA